MNTEIKSGGPAFAKGDYVSRPCDSNQRIVKGADGMTLRDYFIAHAPAEPQPWFQPVMPEERPSNSAENAPERLRREILADQQDDYSVTISPEARDWINAARRRVYAWDAERDKQRYIQWPAAWADAMIAAREAA